MPTKAELKKKPVKMKVRKGDKVMIIAGKDKGETGYIYAVSPKENKVIVLKENADNKDQPLPLNAVIKHRKPQGQGQKGARVQLPSPLDASNVMLLDPKTNLPTRVGRRKAEDGKLVRYAKGSGTEITVNELPA
jgi:large subunit ribosomal protein L24